MGFHADRRCSGLRIVLGRDVPTLSLGLAGADLTRALGRGGVCADTVQLARVTIGAHFDKDKRMTGRGLLLNELDWIVANCCRLFELIKAEHLDWRPRDDMRPLKELVNHLAQIPAVDLRIVKGDGEMDVEKLEESLDNDNPATWCGVMKDGARDMRRFMELLSFDDYENGSATAYFGRTQTHARWLLEAVNHIYHHRAQVFMCQRLIGYDVGTRELYT